MQKYTLHSVLRQMATTAFLFIIAAFAFAAHAKADPISDFFNNVISPAPRGSWNFGLATPVMIVDNYAKREWRDAERVGAQLVLQIALHEGKLIAAQPHHCCRCHHHYHPRHWHHNKS